MKQEGKEERGTNATEREGEKGGFGGGGETKTRDGKNEEERKGRH